MLHLIACFSLIIFLFFSLTLGCSGFGLEYTLYSNLARSLEETQQLEVERALVLANQGSVMWQMEKGNKLSKGQMGSEDLSQSITSVCGVVLSRLTPRPEVQVSSDMSDAGS